MPLTDGKSVQRADPMAYAVLPTNACQALHSDRPVRVTSGVVAMHGASLHELALSK